MSNGSDDIWSTAGRLIVDGASPRRLAKLVGRRAAARYFASEHGRLNDRAAVADRPCFRCSALNPAMLTIYQWEARLFDGIQFGPLDLVLLLVGHVRLKAKMTTFSFQTFHPTCEACGRSLRTARTFATVLNLIAVVSLLIGVLPLIFAACGLFYYDRPDMRRSMWEMVEWFGPMVAVGATCLWAMRRLRVPGQLRYLGRRPFGFSSAKLVRRVGRQ